VSFLVGAMIEQVASDCSFTAVIIGILNKREAIASEKLLKTESLAAMGKSLAAVAHDIKAPLAVIGGFARQLSKKFTY
jgi:signal transduction histidine kinase